MSTWMTLAPGAKAATLPVTRSSKRAPRAISRSRALHRGHRGVVAVHAGHAQALRVRVGERAAGHQRRDDRDAGALGEAPAGLPPARAFRMPPPDVEHRALGRRASASRRPADQRRGRRPSRAVAGQVELARSTRASTTPSSTLATSLGTSMSTGPGRPGRGDVEGGRDHSGDLVGVDFTSQLCLVIPMVMPVMSHSWKASVPIEAGGHLAGSPRPAASSPCRRWTSGVTMFVAPGPARHHGHARPSGDHGRSPRPCGPRPARGARGCGGSTSR